MTRPASTTARTTVCSATLFFGLFSGFLAFAGTGVRAEGIPDTKSLGPSHTLQSAAENHCHAYGPRYSAVGDTGLCVLVGGGILVQAAKEFTNHDIYLIGQRIPTLFSEGAGVPMVYYHADDIRKQTRYPALGTIASAHMMLRGDSDVGLLRGFVRVTGDAHTHYDKNDGSVSVDLRKIDDSYYWGALEEAWVQWNGVKVGIQPSMFGFNRLPSVVTPGYTSIVTTLAASFTHAITPNMSVSFAAEDPERRLMGDGILARPRRSNTPDYVGMARLATPSTLFHVSGAIHHADDHVVSDFLGGSAKSVNGWAFSAGLQSRVKWDEFLGPAADGLLGRVGLTFAHASGAIAYLGIPFFSPDYVVDGDGTIHRSNGWSALASYEHMLAPRVKLNLNASFFAVDMHSAPEEVIPHLDKKVAPLPGLDFEVDVRGAVLQAGIEFNPMKGMVIGVEAGYTTTEAKGRYIGIEGEKANADFPHVGVYLRQTF